jgi:hypothetical protein
LTFWPEQRDLHHAPLDQIAGLGEHALRRPRHLGAAGVGHHAEGAELVAALLHGQEGRGARLDGRPSPARQVLELVLGGKFGIDTAFAPPARDQLGQPVIGLRPEHQIDQRRAAHDLLALGLGDAAGHADHQLPGFAGASAA